MANVYTFPGGVTTYVPTLHEDLLVSFIRNPAKFPINRYINLRMVDKQKGFYVSFQNSAQARITSNTTFAWPDGADAPQNTQGVDPHQFLTFNAAQYGYTDQIGYLAVEQGSWDVLGHIAAQLTMRGMTARSLRVANTLSNFANYPANAQLTASSFGATWANATSTTPSIRNSLMTAANIIQKNSLGVVNLSDLYVVMNPDTAKTVSVSGEWIDFIKQSPSALTIWQGQEQYNTYNIPNMVFGMNVVVDDTVYVTSLPGTNVTTSYSYTFPDNAVAVISKQQAIQGSMVPAFSTMELFCYKNFETLVYNDVKNRRYDVQVLENVDDSFIYANQTGCLIFPNS